MDYAIRVAVSAMLLVAVAELAKRSSHLAALLASIPLTSVLAFVWLYRDTGSAARVAALSTGIFWMVLPSLVLFLALPLLLRLGVNFWLSLAGAAGLTAACYWLMGIALRKAGIAI